MILCLAVSVEHRLVTDRHTTVAYTVLAWRCAVKTAFMWSHLTLSNVTVVHLLQLLSNVISCTFVPTESVL